MNLTSKENRAEKSSILFALLAITGTIFPIIAGLFFFLKEKVNPNLLIRFWN